MNLNIPLPNLVPLNLSAPTIGIERENHMREVIRKTAALEAKEKLKSSLEADQQSMGGGLSDHHDEQNSNPEDETPAIKFLSFEMLHPSPISPEELASKDRRNQAVAKRYLYSFQLIKGINYSHYC